ncbi:MAG: hypothetical protein ACREQY_19730, partial [Candidatus Binatia bacterium]
MSGGRIAVVGPLPPVRSGIADYLNDLLPHLRSRFDLEVFVGDDHPLADRGRCGDVVVHPVRQLDALAYDGLVYQMGNNAHHEFVLELAHRRPGILVLHDLVLHHLYHFLAVTEHRWDLYGEALRESYGAAGEAMLRWKRWWLASSREDFVFPLFECVAARSLGVIVHSRSAVSEVERRVPSALVRRVTMGIPLEEPIDPKAARRRLGIADGEVIVGMFGFVTPIKRVDV